MPKCSAQKWAKKTQKIINLPQPAQTQNQGVMRRSRRSPLLIHSERTTPKKVKQPPQPCVDFGGWPDYRRRQLVEFHQSSLSQWQPKIVTLETISRFSQQRTRETSSTAFRIKMTPPNHDHRFGGVNNCLEDVKLFQDWYAAQVQKRRSQYISQYCHFGSWKLCCLIEKISEQYLGKSNEKKKPSREMESLVFSEIKKKEESQFFMSDEKTFSKKVPVESPLLSLQNNFKDRQALLIH